MKTIKTHALLLSVILGASTPFALRGADPQPAPAPTNPPSAQPPETAPQTPNQPAGPKATVGTEPGPIEKNSADTAAAAPLLPNGEKGLRLNFRGAPLEMVLNYLSDAAGFIIVPKVDVKGKVDVWSSQPLSKDEAIDVLNSVLNKNGYAAIRSGRTLEITTQEDAKKKNIPVKVGNDPQTIPKNDEMVTQIIPVRYANATQLTKDLQPLLPSYANLTANESGNALVLTDTQASVRRMAEIVKALDTSISSGSTIQVFPLRYADAKEVANEIKEVFAPAPTTTQGVGGGGGGRGQFFRMFGGGGGGGAGATGGGGGANTRVVAVADERSNSVVVSAPAETMETIITMVKQVDSPISDVTELRVFHLLNADPLEMVDVFTQLFPDETKTSSQNQNQGFRFRGGPFGGPFNAPQTAQAGESERMKKMTRVSAVADQRTSSIIVSAASELMPQIEAMVHQLDATTAKKQRVFVYSLQNADPQAVEQVLQDMFQRNTTSMNRNTANQISPLNTRSQQNQQMLGTSTLGGSRGGATGGGGLGGGLGGGGLGGGALR
ncbi:MAG: secretin N-terminal domain-containing protein [Limisphaerales bacterium]